MKRLWIVLLLVGLAGCGGGGGGGFNLVGNWRNTVISEEGYGVASCPASIGHISCSGNNQITFGGNGTFTATDGQDSFSGTWVLQGNTLTLTATTPFQQTFVAEIHSQDNAFAIPDDTYPDAHYIFSRL